MRLKLLGPFILLALVMVPAVVAAEPGKSPSDPIPAGEPGQISPYTLRITGWDDNATNQFRMENPDVVESDLPNASRYIIIDVTLTYNGDDIGHGLDVHWSFIGPENAELSNTHCPTTWQSVVNNAPERADVFPGGSVHYQHCAIVPDNAIPTLQPYVRVNNYERLFLELPQAGKATPESRPTTGSM